MNETTNFAEYTVEKKCEGTYRLKRILLKIALWLPLFLLSAIFIVLNIPVWVILVPVYPLIWMKILKPVFYPYVYIEYEYTIASGSMRFAEVLGKCKRREKLDILISDMETIAPYNEQYRAAADASDIVNRYEFVSTMKAPEIYFATFEEDGEKSVVFFQPTNKALGLLRFHNRAAVVTKVSV